jgi:hypothetical protein
MRIRSFDLMVLLAVMAGCSVLACGKKDGKSKDEGKPAEDMTAGMTTEPAPPPDKPVEPAAGPAADAELEKALQAIVGDCEVNESAFFLPKCKGDLRAKLRERYLRREKKIEDALDTVTKVFTGADLKLKIAALDFILTANSLNTVSQDVTFKKDAVARFFTAVEGLAQPELVKRLAAFLASIMTMTEQDDALFKLADAKGGDVLVAILRSAMRYGRLRVFPKLQGYAKGDKPAVVQAALQAPASLDKPSDAELAAVCPWAEPFLTHDNDGVFQAAGEQMIRCKGAYIDKLLAEGEKRLKVSKFNMEHYYVFREICFTSITGTAVPGTEKQCEANYRFLEQVARNEKIDGELRAWALYAIFYQRRDQKTMDLFKKWANHTDAKIKERVRETIKDLKKDHGLK